MKSDSPRDNSSALEKLAHALPEEFDFYHLGKVKQDRAVATAPAPVIESRVAVAFRIQGDIRGVFMVLFDRGLDSSLYMEMGNVIASRAATELNRSESLDVLISPPQLLSEALTAKFLNQAPAQARRRYLHRHDGQSIAVETVILPASSLNSPPEGIAGYA